MLYEMKSHTKNDVDDLVQDCSNSIAKALELLQSWTKPSMSSYLSSWLYNFGAKETHLNEIMTHGI